NSTFSRNMAINDKLGISEDKSGGRDIFNFGDSAGVIAFASLVNNILGQDDTDAEDFTGRSSGGGAEIAAGQGNLIRTMSGFTGLVGRPADPPLADLASNGGPMQTMALGPKSPAIDAAYQSIVPATDQRGAVRIGLADIGAYERRFVANMIVNTEADETS